MPALMFLAHALLGLGQSQAPLLTPDVHRLIPDGEEGGNGHALGDVDGDGDLDLVQARKVWLNQGDARFVEHEGHLPPQSPYYEPHELELADLDGDGDLDLAITDEVEDLLCMNDGAGDFGGDVRRLPPSPYGSSGCSCGEDLTIALELGDLDGDGDLDLLLGDRSYNCESGCPTSGNVRFLANDGTGLFADRSHSLPASLRVIDLTALELADVDGDRDLDLVVTRTGNGWDHDSVFLNDGHASYTETPGAMPTIVTWQGAELEAFDMDLDGDLDLAFGHHSLSLLENDGHGIFSDASQGLPSLTEHHFTGLASGDLDRDGDQDLLAASFDTWTQGRSPCVLLTNEGGGVFVDTSSELPDGIVSGRDVALGDFDGDGDLDAVLELAFRLRVWLNDGRARFAGFDGLIPALSEFHTWAVAQGDLDGDGELDLAIEGNLLLSVHLNDGSGEFSEKLLPSPQDSFETISLALGDVDGDQDLDLVAANDFGPEVLYLNDGHGGFAVVPGKLSTPHDRTRLVALLDLDGDGDLDLFAGASHGASRIYLNGGAGDFTWAPGLWPNHFDYVSHLDHGDIEGDGDLDLLLMNPHAVLYVNDGTGKLTERNPFQGPPVNIGFDLGDVDRDGDLDVIAIRGQAPRRRMLLYLNDGGGMFQDASSQLLDMPYQPISVYLHDLEPDGDLDIVINGPLALRNDGNGVFAPPERLTTLESEIFYGLLSADFDRDGDTDFIAAPGYSEFRLLKNTTTHLAWLSPPRPGRALDFDLRGAPNGRALLLGSLGRADTWIPGLGLLRIDRSRLFFDALVEFDDQGLGTARYDVPNDAALIGVSHFWQALELSPRRLTNLEITTYGAY